MLALCTLFILAAAPVPKDAGFGRITIWVGNELVSMMPDGTDVAKTPTRKAGLFESDFKLSTDAKTVVYRGPMAAVRPALPAESRLELRAIDNDKPALAIEGVNPFRHLISPDGATVYISGPESGANAKVEPVHENWSYDVASQKLTKLPLPERKYLDAASSDGKMFLLGGSEPIKDHNEWRNYLVSADGKKSTLLADSNCLVSCAAFSPGGDRLYAIVTTYDPFDARGFNVMRRQTARETVMIDVATGKQTKLLKPPFGDEYGHIAWSPDGKKIAFTIKVAPANPLQLIKPLLGGPLQIIEYDIRVFVADADGRNVVEIHKLKDEGIRAIVWR